MCSFQVSAERRGTQSPRCNSVVTPLPRALRYAQGGKDVGEENHAFLVAFLLVMLMDMGPGHATLVATRVRQNLSFPPWLPGIPGYDSVASLAFAGIGPDNSPLNRLVLSIQPCAHAPGPEAPAAVVLWPTWSRGTNPPALNPQFPSSADC